ncbi:hypothetical protein AAG570_001392 [Ranatra chinensis]|uniref:non-specific serine/threonine protein kinase n=1 Tax=Ranatra chinensis TaxID=642074 RepID=A0ABD0YBR1_9HEMI
MNLIDESYKIDEFQYMRSHYQKALYHFLSVAKSTLAENKTIYPASFSSILNLRSDDILEWSRYSTEFRELKFIAKGGFGHVFKSQNLLDGGIYAIKKLFLSYRSINGFLQNLREVKMLARLNHPNIVAYKAAWLEPLESNTTKTKKVEVTVCYRMEVSNGDSLEVVFEHSILASYIKAYPVVYRSKREKKQHYKFTYTSTMGSRSTNCAILFIQMQLCQLTLRQWLDERNQLPHVFDIRNSLEIFKQIVRGVQYIHSQGIVHHDIKPSNIFVSMDLKQVQVGDFGLSCLLSHSQSPSPSGYTSHQLGQYGGTKLYAAPEQMKNMCHPKSDIYSLGLVLLELIKPFQTAMERCKVLSQLKAGQVPPDIASTWPHLVSEHI